MTYPTASVEESLGPSRCVRHSLSCAQPRGTVALDLTPSPLQPLAVNPLRATALGHSDRLDIPRSPESMWVSDTLPAIALRWDTETPAATQEPVLDQVRALD